jgi:hypothetical protein
MGSARSGITDASHASGPMRPLLWKRTGRPVGAIALPPIFPQPTGAAPAPPAATATRRRSLLLASPPSPWPPTLRVNSPSSSTASAARRTGYETTCQEASYADPHKTTCETTLTEDTGHRFATFR